MSQQPEKSFTYEMVKKALIHLFIVIILTAIICHFYADIETLLSDKYIINTVERLGSFLEMSIGIYIAVISILATARTSVTEKLSQNNKHINFIITISIGFTETVLALIFSEILFQINIITKAITLSLILLSIYQIAIFFFAVLIMFNITVSDASSEAQSENEKHKQIIISLDKIQNRLNQIIKK